jgi:dihydroxyacid dehydratase/phosphogluconate dehydratase
VSGNLAPDGAIIKATAIDPSVVDADGVYRRTGPARVFTSERAAIAAIKSRGEDRIRAGEVIVLAGRGPLGAAWKRSTRSRPRSSISTSGKTVALLTDARFSGVSTGPCIGHVGPEALAGGPIGRLRDGDRVRVIVDRARLDGTIDLVTTDASGTDVPADDLLASRTMHPDIAPDPGSAARDATVGRVAERERRAMGRLRV